MVGDFFEKLVGVRAGSGRRRRRSFAVIGEILFELFTVCRKPVGDPPRVPAASAATQTPELMRSAEQCEPCTKADPASAIRVGSTLLLRNSFRCWISEPGVQPHPPAMSWENVRPTQRHLDNQRRSRCLSSAPYSLRKIEITLVYGVTVQKDDGWVWARSCGDVHRPVNSSAVAEDGEFFHRCWW